MKSAPSVALLCGLLLSGAPRCAVAGDQSPFGLKLGDLENFSTESLARQRCAPDPVVWADAATGFFYNESDPEFGKAQPGGFACKRAAETADYWDHNPFSSTEHRGRSFPINPDLLCNMCS